MCCTAWFFRNFQDPVHHTPFCTEEGGYLYLHGGPYSAEDEIIGAFGAAIGGDLLHAAVEQIELEGCTEWAGLPEEEAPLGPPPSRHRFTSARKPMRRARSASPTPHWRALERELVTLFQSFGRTTVFDVSGEPAIRYVRVFKPAEDGTIRASDTNVLSLRFVARLLANKFRSTKP
jgi:hypothetical protein